ncbi:MULTISPECIES: MurR/RpiR family transcriptional regulator [unclassified Paenibacillus]|uniref:MurR/RpiR family transcriptional regulator n=1 Tax=unclassified Paenibacillus TaxID=185978 RepID=UPI002780A410|nr:MULTISPECIES: MurR/RpiR family transcriptional regulator [unclassified Paenibacillus]MDQ0900652.1 DNA-binding MurR/RpiR family transcriptional regulator [Paenibacillus sp. V4I7]MDQ0920840.1 DNA-binding MurR/RpiR family transcriptional regulator [Paenibacillus sp. V4I5]
MADNHLAQSLSGGLIMLQEIAEQLPPSERKIALYIIENPHEAIRCTANELGELSSTSASAVIRLCKSLGLSGFQELKLRVAGDMRNSNEVGFTDFEPDEPQPSIVQKVTANSVRALQETAEIMNYEALGKAVEALERAQSIHFFGVGASAVIAQDAQLKFVRVNRSTTSNTDFHISAMLVAQSNKKDVVVGISFSGETYEVGKLLELAKEKGATTISLTSYGLSPISEIADINLFVSAKQEEVFRSAATSSRLAQLHLIDILFMCVLTNQYEASIQHLDEVRMGVNFIKQNTALKKQ